MKKIVFIIISCIYPYTYDASIEEIDRRTKETNRTIKSIKEICPNAYIYI